MLSTNKNIDSSVPAATAITKSLNTVKRVVTIITLPARLDAYVNFLVALYSTIFIAVPIRIPPKTARGICDAKGANLSVITSNIIP